MSQPALSQPVVNQPVVNQPADRLAASRASSAALDELAAALTEAIEALTAWQLDRLQRAVERQRELCQRLAGCGLAPRDAQTMAAAQRVRELNRIYDRVLRHSLRWTRILLGTLEAAGAPGRAGWHFRG